MDDATRRRAREMTEDISIWDGLSVPMAVVLKEYVDRVAVLEAANSTQREVMQAAIAEAREESRERWGLLCEERARVAELEGELKEWKQRAARMALMAKPLIAQRGGCKSDVTKPRF